MPRCVPSVPVLCAGKAAFVRDRGLLSRCMRPVLLIMLVCGLVWGCAPRPEIVPPAPPVTPEVPPVAKPAEPEEERFVELSAVEALTVVRGLSPAAQGLASWRDMAPAVERSLAYARSKPAGDMAIRQASVAVTWGAVRTTLETLRDLLPRLDKEPDLLAQRFRWLKVAKGNSFTGYYEPVLKASRTPKKGYPQPLYAMPPDLKTLDLGKFRPQLEGQSIVYRIEKGEAVPYHDRAAIDGQGVLRGKGLELAWAADPVEVFILQVQGSGKLQFEDGSEVHVLYAGQNGRPYVALGRVMRDRGLQPADGMNMDTMRQWLRAHPERVRELLDTNPSYIFFNIGGDGPNGSMGSKLTPWVSLAVDRQSLPMGAPVAFAVDIPQQGGGKKPMQGLGLAQDIGGAIKNNRIDLFCGKGDRANFVASRLNAKGQTWLLLVREGLGN